MTQTAAFIKALRDTVAYNLRAIDRELDDLSKSPQTDAVEELNAKAMVMFYAGMYEQARPLLNALVAVRPSERSIVKLAQVEARLGNHERAISLARKAMEANSTSLGAYEVMATSNLALGHLKEASATADDGLKAHPQASRLTAVKVLVTRTAGGPLPDGGVMALVSQYQSTDLGRLLSNADMGVLISRVEA